MQLACEGCYANLFAGPRLVSFDSNEAELLEAVFNALLPGSHVDLAVADWNAIGDGDVNVLSFLQTLQTNLTLASPEEALSADVTLGQIFTAAADVVPADGETADLHAALLSLSLDLDVSELAGTIQIGDLLQITFPDGSFADVDVNALNLVTGFIQLYNYENVATTNDPVALSGTVLNNSAVNTVEVWAQVIEPPIIDPVLYAGDQFYSAAIRLKLNVDLVDFTVLGTGVQIADLSIYVDIARAQGEVVEVCSVTGVLPAVTIDASHGVTNVYLGTIDDSLFFNRTHVIDPLTDLDFATIGSVQVLLGPLLDVEAKGYAEGTAPFSSLLEFFGPFPETQTAGTSATFIDNAIDDLLTSSAGSYTNTVSVSSDTPDDPQGDPNTVADTNPVIMVTDLQIIKTSGTTSVAVGGPVTYTILVTNAGPSDAIGARVIDMFPSTLIDVSYTSTVTGTVSGNTPLGFGNIDDTVNMMVGSTITYTATATLSASATGTLTNIATVIPGPDADDPNPDDNVDSRLIPIESPGLIIVSPDKGNASQPWIHVVSRDTGELLVRFLAFEEGYLGGIRVATGDLTGDGIPEIVAVRGRNSTPDVRIFDLNGNLLMELQVFPASFTGGVDIAVGDVDGDGRNDLVAAMSYLGSQVVIFRNTTASAPDSPLTFERDKSFYPFGASFIGGVVVAVADMGERQGNAFLANWDDRAEIIVGNEAGMRSTVKVFDYDTLQAVRTFYPFTSAFIGGISLDVARINADLIPDLIVGIGPTGGSNVEVLDGTLPPKSTLLSFVAYSAAETSSYNAPVRVAAVDADGDGWADVIVTAQGTNGSTGIIKVFGVTAPAQLVGQFSGNLPDPSDFGGAYFVSDVRTATSTRLEASAESLLTSASWTNPILAEDVNGDGIVTALDALLVINDLNATGPRFLTGSPPGGYFPDVDNSGSLEPLDVLGVIKYLSSPQSRGAGEGESGDSSSPDPLPAPNWGGLGAIDRTPGRSARLYPGVSR